MRILRALVALIAGEPVVAIAGFLTSAVVWLATYVLHGWNPTTHAQEIAGAATTLAIAASWIARQFVAPAAKLTPHVVFRDNPPVAPPDSASDEPPPFPGGAPEPDPAPPAAIGA